MFKNEREDVMSCSFFIIRYMIIYFVDVFKNYHNFINFCYFFQVKLLIIVAPDALNIIK